MNKIEALTKHLDLSLCEYQSVKTEDNQRFEFGDTEYLVLTEDEADLAVKNYIDQTLWAFNASFLVGYIDDVSDLGDVDSLIKVIKTIQEEMYENCNGLLFALVRNNFNELVDDAIEADGRGHFLSFYDGQEHEVGDYFIYRTN